MACARNFCAFFLNGASSRTSVLSGLLARGWQSKQGSGGLLPVQLTYPSQAYEASKAWVTEGGGNPHSASHFIVSQSYDKRGFLRPDFLTCQAAATAGSGAHSAGVFVVPAVVPLLLTCGQGTALFNCNTLASACASWESATVASDVSQRKHFSIRALHWHVSLPLHSLEKPAYNYMPEPLDCLAAYARRTTLDGWEFAERERTQGFPDVQRLHDASTCTNLCKHRFRFLPFTLSSPSPSLISVLCLSPLSSSSAFVCILSNRASYSATSLFSYSTCHLSSSSASLPSLACISSRSSSISLKSHFICKAPSSLSFLSFTTPFSISCILTPVRFKMVKSASYRRPPRASPTGQARKPHIGPRRLSAEYVTPGVVLVKQRKFVAFNLETKRRKRHFKMYPGENVGVTSSTHLVSLAHGRVKYTHDVTRDVMIVNVLPERKEELLRQDLWRYRTEHVRTVEENRHICFLRMKATRVFPKELINPPTKPELRPYHFTKRDTWENPTLPDVSIFDDDR